MLLAATVLAAKKEADATAAPSCSGSQFVSGGSAANGLITCYNNAGVGKYRKEFGELAKALVVILVVFLVVILVFFLVQSGFFKRKRAGKKMTGVDDLVRTSSA